MGSLLFSEEHMGARRLFMSITFACEVAPVKNRLGRTGADGRGRTDGCGGTRTDGRGRRMDGNFCGRRSRGRDPADKAGGRKN